MAYDSDFRDGMLYWTECTSAEVPADDLWLRPQEQLRLQAFAIPKRRADWRLGRWTAKSAVRELLHLNGLNLSRSQIEIRVRPTGAPYAWVLGECINLSLSHSNGLAFCVVSHLTAIIGCDIERIEPRSESFVRDYFTFAEQHCIEATINDQQKHTLITLLWSAKESTLKALEIGLRTDPARLSVTGDLVISPSESRDHSNGRWKNIEIEVDNVQSLSGSWFYDSGFIKTVVYDPNQQLSGCSINGV